MAHLKVVGDVDDPINEKSKLLRGVDDIMSEDLSHRLEYVEKKQDVLLNTKIPSLEKDQESINASLKVIEYVVYCKNDGSLHKDSGSLGVENQNPMSSDQVRDKGKGKGIANETGIEKGLARKGGLIHDISSTDERVGEEYNPDILFPLSDADDVSLEINEKLSTPKPPKMQLTKQHQAQTLGIGKCEKLDEWNDVFGSNMMGINEVFLPDDITPIKGGSTTKNRGRPPGSASGKYKTPRPRFNSAIRTPSLASLEKPKGHIFPPGVWGNFKPKPEFDLTWAEMRMTLYVFNKDLDPRFMFQSLRRKVLEKVISSFDYAKEMWKTPTDFSAWEFKEVQGLPNLGTCWRRIKTRKQTAVKLILGHYNELRATIEAKTPNIWMSLPI
ncbi:hypothetical protein RIF29_20714 [Crotalaria pallida]|uniref:Uncharacterized protein n=1 Tax=Crotalaria pallida TaxID=3830 RepID=A0AAN9ICP9_CROPI